MTYYLAAFVVITFVSVVVALALVTLQSRRIERSRAIARRRLYNRDFRVPPL